MIWFNSNHFSFSPLSSPKRERGSYAKIWEGATWPSSNQTTIEYGSSFLYVNFIYKYLCFVRCGAPLWLRGVSHCALISIVIKYMSYSDLNDDWYGLGVGLSFGGVSPCEPQIEAGWSYSVPELDPNEWGLSLSLEKDLNIDLWLIVCVLFQISENNWYICIMILS